MPHETFKVVKRRWADALLSVICCCLVKESQFLTSPSEEDEKERKIFGCLATFLFGIFAMLFAPLCMFFVINP